MVSEIRRRIVPPIAIKLYDTEFRLTFDFNTLSAIKEKTGLDLAAGELVSGIDVEHLGQIIQLAGLPNHPELAGEAGLDAVRSYLDAGNIDDAAIQLITGFAERLPEKKKKAYLEVLEKAQRIASGEDSENPTQAATEKAQTPPDQDGSNAGPLQDTTSA